MTFRSWFRKNFLAGILVLVPLLGTAALFWWLFAKVTGPGYGWMLKRIGNREYAEFLKENQFLFRLIVLFLMLGATILVGVVARNFAGRRVIRLGETVFEKLPVVNRVFKGLKQISEAFLGQGKTAFSGVVAIEYPKRGVYAIGLLSSAGRRQSTGTPGEKLVGVLLPTTPNPTSGYLVILPEKDVIPLNMTVEDALKLIVSGGAVVPEGFKAGVVLAAKNEIGQKALQGAEAPSSSG